MCCPDTTRTIHETVVAGNEQHAVESIAWNPHAKFPGVALKHLVTGSDTGGRMSIHHVRINPGCEIGDHTHAGMVEVHDVLAGDGTCTVKGNNIRYVPGVIGVMPADTVHRIVAGDRGLLLLATFSPPLV
jgi:quercetin dioxygenase-like cupin family protein